MVLLGGYTIMNTLKSIWLALIMLSVGTAQCESATLEANLAASHDNQTIEVTGYEYIKGLSVAKNVTIVGTDDNATIDGSYLEHIPAIGDRNRSTIVTFKDLVVRNCSRFYTTANLVIDHCRFIGSDLEANNCTLLIKNSTFEHSVNGNPIGFGGAASLDKVAGIFDHCKFIKNSAYRSGDWNGGSGGALWVRNSTIALIDPEIRENKACTGGGLCVIDSTIMVYGGNIADNHALEVNIPTAKFGGIGAAIDVIGKSKVVLAGTSITGNHGDHEPSIAVEQNSDLRIIGSQAEP
jgi:hypothetical protein